MRQTDIQMDKLKKAPIEIGLIWTRQLTNGNIGGEFLYNAKKKYPSYFDSNGDVYLEPQNIKNLTNN